MKDCRERLNVALNRLNEERQDHHDQPSPVEDIIDPDLLICRPDEFNRDAWIEWRAKEHGDSYDLSASQFETLEDTYQWMPSESVIDTRGHVTITTAIGQLERTAESEQIYRDLAEVFEAMLPAFQKTEMVGESAKPGNTLQIIVKAQSYNLKSGMKYAGRWHTEGNTENIIAAGVYYVHFDEQLEDGALKFRLKHAPQPWYDIPTDVEASVSTDAAIAFSNTISHRFRQIRNLTNSDLRRTFLNFFIVDPRKPIKLHSFSTRVLAPTGTILEILSATSEGRLMIGPILDKIIGHLGSTAWKNVDEAKAFRARVRRAMLQDQSGWEWIEWENCGFVEFVQSHCLYERKNDCERLEHTGFE